MAEQDAQDAENAAAGGAAKSGGIVRLAGLAAGLFVLMSLAQLTTTIVTSKFMPELSGQTAASGDGADTDTAGEAVIDVAALDPPIYTSLDQPLIVSYKNGSEIRFLQLSIDVMARDEASISAFTAHRPAIKNNLLTLFASRDLEELATVPGKEKARAAALIEVQSVLTMNDPDAKIEDLYFTSFVVQ